MNPGKKPTRIQQETEKIHSAKDAPEPVAQPKAEPATKAARVEQKDTPKTDGEKPANIQQEREMILTKKEESSEVSRTTKPEAKNVNTGVVTQTKEESVKKTSKAEEKSVIPEKPITKEKEKVSKPKETEKPSMINKEKEEPSAPVKEPSPPLTAAERAYLMAKPAVSFDNAKKTEDDEAKRERRAKGPESIEILDEPVGWLKTEQVETKEPPKLKKPAAETKAAKIVKEKVQVEPKVEIKEAPKLSAPKKAVTEVVGEKPARAEVSRNEEAQTGVTEVNPPLTAAEKAYLQDKPAVPVRKESAKTEKPMDGEVKELKVTEAPKPMQTLGVPKIKEPSAQSKPHSPDETKKPKAPPPDAAKSFLDTKNLLKPVQVG